LTLSQEFAEYADGTNGQLIVDTLIYTFAHYSSFDEYELFIGTSLYQSGTKEFPLSSQEPYETPDTEEQIINSNAVSPNVTSTSPSSGNNDIAQSSTDAIIQTANPSVSNVPVDAAATTVPAVSPDPTVQSNSVEEPIDGAVSYVPVELPASNEQTTTPIPTVQPNSAEEPIDGARFTARITQILGNIVLCEVVGNESIFFLAGSQVSFSKSELEVIDVSVGDVVTVTFTGDVLEMEPVQVMAVSWEKAE
jgi:hypothetical protein